MEPVGFGRQAWLGVAVEAVGDEEDDGAVPQNAARPGAVEVVETGTEAGSSGPVLDLAATAGEGFVGIAAAEDAGDVGEPGGEEEGLDAGVDARKRVQVVQEHLGVAPHRARDVAEDDEG